MSGCKNAGFLINIWLYLRNDTKHLQNYRYWVRQMTVPSFWVAWKIFWNK